MESLESKLDRLAPEQRKEVEDFVDFLIFRSGESQAIPQAPSISSQAPPPLETVPLSPPPRPVPAPAQESPSTGEDWITRDYMDYGQFDEASSPATESVKKVKQKISRREEHEKPHPLLDWID
jgi:hypothetical protein